MFCKFEQAAKKKSEECLEDCNPSQYVLQARYYTDAYYADY
jgi:hypothetical protein